MQIELSNINKIKHASIEVGGLTVIEGVSKFSPSFFMPKAPTFTSWGFVIT